MKIEEVRKTLIEVIKHLDTYSDGELVEIKGIADKIKEMAMYEEFCREKEITDEMYRISEEDFQFVSDMENWGSVHGYTDLMLRVLDRVEGNK